MLIGLSELLFQRRVTRLPDAISFFQCRGVQAIAIKDKPKPFLARFWVFRRSVNHLENTATHLLLAGVSLIHHDAIPSFDRLITFQ